MTATTSHRHRALGARLRGDAGQVAGIEALPFGLLVFVVGSLLAANAWAVVDVRSTVDAAAREAVRSYVEAPDERTALASAEAAARAAVEGHGRRPEKLVLTVDTRGRPFGRCARVQVTARYPVPAVTLPFLGSHGTGTEARAVHSEVIDPWRSGLQGPTTCTR